MHNSCIIPTYEAARNPGFNLVPFALRDGCRPRPSSAVNPAITAASGDAQGLSSCFFLHSYVFFYFFLLTAYCYVLLWLDRYQMDNPKGPCWLQSLSLLTTAYLGRHSRVRLSITYFVDDLSASPLKDLDSCSVTVLVSDRRRRVVRR